MGFTAEARQIGSGFAAVRGLHVSVSPSLEGCYIYYGLCKIGLVLQTATRPGALVWDLALRISDLRAKPGDWVRFFKRMQFVIASR